MCTPSVCGVSRPPSLPVVTAAPAARRGSPQGLPAGLCRGSQDATWRPPGKKPDWGHEHVCDLPDRGHTSRKGLSRCPWALSQGSLLLASFTAQPSTICPAQYTSGGDQPQPMGGRRSDRAGAECSERPETSRGAAGGGLVVRSSVPPGSDWSLSVRGLGCEGPACTPPTVPPHPLPLPPLLLIFLLLACSRPASEVA